jgi:hypothetical protein
VVPVAQAALLVLPAQWVLVVPSVLLVLSDLVDLVAQPVLREVPHQSDKPTPTDRREERKKIRKKIEAPRFAPGRPFFYGVSGFRTPLADTTCGAKLFVKDSTYLLTYLPN